MISLVMFVCYLSICKFELSKRLFSFMYDLFNFQLDVRPGQCTTVPPRHVMTAPLAPTEVRQTQYVLSVSLEARQKRLARPVTQIA